MKYISTRGNYKKVESAEAIRLGMVPTGGLFVPEEIPSLSIKEIEQMQEDDYQEIAYKILKKYLSDFTTQELKEVITNTYNQENFATEKIAPLKKLNQNIYILELWQGPTAAFKDMALQLMPHLLKKAVAKGKIEKEIVILVATSGDTGTAALEGFKNIDGIKIVVFYPETGVSKIQEAQMVTVDGDNTEVVAVKGNFDDCQNAVKEIFGDRRFNQLVKLNNYQFSSANSINWGRLVPQIIYYFAAYSNLLSNNHIKSGEKINITVPTGNFGNILASYYAYRMGLPVRKFICASNANNILTEFLKTGIYDMNRDFKKTISPSMDILISSNLERFLFEINGHDASKIKKWYQQLKQTGKFEIDDKTKEKIDDIFIGEYASESETKAAIADIFDNYHYTIDPHTAVGVKSYQKYINKCEDETTTIIDSTANPYKFGEAVLEAITGKTWEKGGFEVLDQLKELTEMEIHPALQGLEQKPVKHKRNCEENEIKQELKDILKIKQ